MESLNIVTTSEMVFGKLPEHPKIIWLGQSNRRYKANQNLNSLDFVVTAPGLLEFPPIPIVLNSKEFFIRLDDIMVVRNETSKTDTKLLVFWNETDTPPQQVHIGEAVEIQYFEMVEDTPGVGQRRSYPLFSEPSSRVEGGQWHQYTQIPGRRAYPEDYFFSFASGGGLFSQRNSNYEYQRREIQGIPYQIRIFKARLYFTRLGTVTGNLAATMGTSPSEQRTQVLPFKIEVLPLPPLPNDQALNTGLVGRWDFQSQILPRQPLPSSPLKIRLQVTGQGNPRLRNEFNFAGEGFPSVESQWTTAKLYDGREDTNYDEWSGTFEQTLIPTGKVGTLPPRMIAYFDTVKDAWELVEISTALTLPGFTDVTASLTPRAASGKSITRPVLLNLPVATFAAFAFAPFLPFLFGFARRKLDARDPILKAREKKLARLVQSFRSGQGKPDDIDRDLLPLLRDHLSLPGGATSGEIAGALDDPELAALLRQHAQASFSATAAPIDLNSLAARLAKLTLLFLICLSSLRGATIEEANAAFAESHFTTAAETYRELIENDPGNANLYFNLAQAYLSANDPARARAACQTALLLDPLDKETHELMSEIRQQQGDQTVSRSRFLSLRPDQWILLSAFFWVGSFLYFGVRKLRPLPLWPAAALLTTALLLATTGIWRQVHDYADDQYMVLADELPRELDAGTPNWDYPPLRVGQIVQIGETTATHAMVTSSDSPFWLPLHQLQQVW